MPILRLHLFAGRVQPGGILYAQLFIPSRCQKPALPQDRIPAAQSCHSFYKVDQCLCAIVPSPIDPGNIIVLTIGIVVSPLRAAEFVASQDHWRSLGEQKRPEQIPLLPLAQLHDLRIMRRTFDAMIPRVIVRVAVAVLFSICHILLVVIGDQIVERKSVMSGDKIYAGPWLAPAAIKEIAGAGDARGEIGNLAFVAFPV